MTIKRELHLYQGLSRNDSTCVYITLWDNSRSQDLATLGAIFNIWDIVENQYKAMVIAMILSSIMLTNRRKAMEVIPESWKKIWDLWEIRFAVLLSLSLQIILIFGGWRKVSSNVIVRGILWLAYNTADSLATFCLSILSSNPADNITAIWAPILLLHLGGPDTITAYSLEDNELWQRNLLKLGVRIGVAGYVLLNAWMNHLLNILGILILIPGIIKCGERIWALWHASRDRFRDSLLTPADPGPNYARYMEEYRLKKREGYDVSLGKLIEDDADQTVFHQEKDSLTEVAIIGKAFEFFGTFQRLYADLILRFDEIQNSQNFLRNRSSDVAFKVIEVELGFTYDLFYTKSVWVHSIPGAVLRCITFSFTLSAFCGFMVTRKDMNHKVSITYVLLAGALFLEMLAVLLLLHSDRATLRLGNYYNGKVGFIAKRKRWSNTMAQYNLVEFCLNYRPAKWNLIQNLNIYKSYKMHRLKEEVNAPDELKMMIFHEFEEKLDSLKASNLKDCKKFCICKGDWVLTKDDCLDKLDWSIGKVEFDQSILLWHIATDLCYYKDFDNEPNRADNNLNPWKASILLSNYMVYILVMCPFMLPSGIGQIRWRDTCAEATEFFEEFGTSKKREACKRLYEVCTDIDPSEVKGDRCKSVLFDGCRLAKDLKSLQTELQWDREKKWKLISRVWIEMLSYAANQCRWTDHAQQLRRGGELLTHVWLLMAHLGITQQFQVSQGHARAKLIVQ